MRSSPTPTTVVCVLIPRFSLLAALSGRAGGGEDADQMMPFAPVALAPEAGREQVVGEVSGSAQSFGVAAGMRVGEALARCPELVLVPPDSDGALLLWSRVLDALEGIGAEVESDRAGSAFFAADGLYGLHGGLEGVLAAVRRALGCPLPGREALTFGARARLGAGPSRFSAYAVASSARAREARGRTVSAAAVREFLAPLPVGLLRLRPQLARLPDTLERLGLRTLGDLAALPAPAVAERFGNSGLLARDLAAGRDTPLVPRRPSEAVLERLALPEPSCGLQLERAVELLVARLLARPERRGRSLRALTLSARFVEGGSWRARATLRQASADPTRIRLVLAPRLAELPAPAESIALTVDAFGGQAHGQGMLFEQHSPGAVRRARLGEAIRHARQTVASDALLRVLELDRRSRLPERRAMLAPVEAD